MRPLILIVGIVYIFQKMLAEPHDNYLFVNDLVCMARKLLTVDQATASWRLPRMFLIKSMLIFMEELHESVL